MSQSNWCHIQRVQAATSPAQPLPPGPQAKNAEPPLAAPPPLQGLGGGGGESVPLELNAPNWLEL